MDNGLASKVAMRWMAASADRRDYTFADLDAESNRFANALTKLGAEPGDVLFTFLPEMPEQFFAFLGMLKLNLIAGPLLPTLGRMPCWIVSGTQKPQE